MNIHVIAASRAAHMAQLAGMACGAVILNRLTEADLAELRETRDALQARMRAVHNQAKSLQGRAAAAGRELTPTESDKINALMSQFDGMESEFETVSAEITAAEDALRGSTPLPRQASPNALASGGAQPRRASYVGGAPRDFSGMFGNGRADSSYAGRFSSLGEFALAVVGGNDARLIRNASMTEGTGVDGGFAVPVQFIADILDAALQMEIVRPRANVVPMASKQALAGVFDYLDGTNNKRAGLQLLFGVGETDPMTEQKAKLREIQLDAKKGHIFVRVSSELAADAPNFDRQLTTAMVNAVAAGLDYYFVSGTGVGTPMGILSSPALITVAKESGQAANTLLLQNLVNMVARLTPASFRNSVWLAHPTLVPQLYLMSYTVKNVAGTENVGGTAAQAITIDADGNLRIFGRPVMITDACSALSSAGDIVLADLSKYLVGLRKEASIARSDQRYFDSDEIAFKLTLRVDGQPQDATATKLRDGTNTVGPFVALGAR